MSEPADSQIEAVAYELSRSQLLSQKDDLRNLRNQASLGAAISGLIATVFSTLVSNDHILILINSSESFDVFFFILPLILFAGSLVFSARVISGWSLVTFDQSAVWILKNADAGHTPREIMRSLAIEAEEFLDKNETVVTSTKTNLWWSLVLSWAQIPAWILIMLGQGV